MVYLLFAFLAAVTVFAAVKLSKYADVIQQKTAMTGFFAGAVLIAGATSLPEVTTSVTAGVIRSPDLAVGNVLGSNAFNLFVLAAVDTWFRKKKMYVHVSKQSAIPALLGLVLTLIVASAFLIRTSVGFLGIGIDVWLIIALYFGGIFYLNHANKLPDEPPAEKKTTLTLKGAIIRFIVAALIIMAAGSYLTVLGDEIAVITGLGQSFIGSLLIAGATSLPEVSVVYLALKRGQYNGAVGVIIGSNMFNLILLGVADLFYRDATLIGDASSVHWITLLALIILTTVMLAAIYINKGIKRVSWLPSVTVITCYVLMTVLLYMYSVN